MYIYICISHRLYSASTKLCDKVLVTTRCRGVSNLRQNKPSYELWLLQPPKVLVNYLPLSNICQALYIAYQISTKGRQYATNIGQVRSNRTCVTILCDTHGSSRDKINTISVIFWSNFFVARGIVSTPLYDIYIDDTILKKNTDHNTTLLTHYASVHIDVALTIYADGKSIRAFILAIKIH